jgi:hypothetical protein
MWTQQRIDDDPYPHNGAKKESSEQTCSIEGSCIFRVSRAVSNDDVPHPESGNNHAYASGRLNYIEITISSRRKNTGDTYEGNHP